MIVRDVSKRAAAHRSVATLAVFLLCVAPRLADAGDCSSYQQGAARERANAARFSSGGTGAGGERAGQRAQHEQAAAAYDNAYRQCMNQQAQQAQRSSQQATGFGGYPTAAPNSQAAAIQQFSEGVAGLIGAWLDHSSRKAAAEAAARQAAEEERLRREQEEEERREREEAARRQRIADMNRDLESSFAESDAGSAAEDAKAAREACKDPVARLANPKNCAWLEEQGDSAISSGRRWAPAGGGAPPPAPVPVPAVAFGPPAPGDAPSGGGDDPLLATGPSVFPEPTWGEPPTQPTALQRLDEYVEQTVRPAAEEARNAFSEWTDSLPSPRGMLGDAAAFFRGGIEKTGRDIGDAVRAVDGFVREAFGVKSEEELAEMDTFDRAVYRFRRDVLPTVALPEAEKTEGFTDALDEWHDQTRADVAADIEEVVR